MSEPLYDWLGSKEVVYCKENTITNRIAHRDPNRICLQNPNYFYSPVDGVIVYQKVVEASQDPSKSAEVLTIANKPYNIRTLTGLNFFNKSCIVIGIYVTMIDVKVTRMPYSGIRQFVSLPTSPSMFAASSQSFEDTLLQGFIDYNKMEFCFFNPKRVNTVVNPNTNHTYYMIQTTPQHSQSCIRDFRKTKEPIQQNERVDQVLAPYLMDIVVPFSINSSMSLQQDIGTHVKAGLDRILKVQRA